VFLVVNAASDDVRAQESASTTSNSQDQSTLEAIEVVVDDIADTGQVEHGDFTGSYQRIERQELERRDVTIADILSHESGVQSRQSGGFGTFSSITVRAASAAQTGVYLDGILLNGGGKAIVDLSMLDLLTLDSVDIYRGTTPQQFSRGTIGGAINLGSASLNNSEPRTQALLGVGSFDTTQLQLSHRSNHGNWDVVSALSVQQSDNNFSFTDDNATPLNPDDDTRQLRNNAAARRVSALARAGLQWNKDSRTDVLAQATSREQGIPDWRNSVDNQASLDSDAMRLHLNHTLDGLGRWNSRHTLFVHDDNDLFDDRLAQTGLGPQNTESTGSTTGFRTYWEHVGDLRSSGFSLEARRETQEASDFINQAFNFNAERRSINASVSTTFFALDDRLLVTPTLQSQLIDDQYNGTTRQSRSSYRKQVLSPQLGARLDLDHGLTLRANVGRFYREPSFGELFISRGFLRGNTNLLPEEGVNADIGFHWTPVKRVSIDASVFASWRDELIATVFDARRTGKTLNLGAARILGLELSANWRINKQWSAKANLTIQDASSVDSFGAFENKQLPGEAPQSAYLRMQYQHQEWRAFIEGDGSWNRFYDQANVLPASDQWLQNLGIDWQHSSITIRASINNLTDQNAEEFNGFPRPGRSFSLSFTTRL